MNVRLIQDKTDKYFAGAVVLVHLLFFLLACHYTRIYMGDSFEYIYEACNMKHLSLMYSGNPAMPIEMEYMTQRQPLYPMLLMLVYAFTVNNWVVLVVQNLLSVFNILLARKLFISLGFNRRYDWLLLLLVVAYPSQFINANTIDPDILLQTFTVLYFGSFVRLNKSNSLKDAAYMSLWLTGGLFVKPVLYPFVAVHAVIMIFFFVKRKVQLQRPLLVAIVPLCAVMLYNYWNYTRTGKFHFSSNQSFNAIYYFDAYYTATQGADSAARFIVRERADLNAIGDFSERYDAANARGITLFKEHFAPYMIYHIKSAGRIFIDPGKAEIDLFTGRLSYSKLYSGKGGGFFDTLKSKGVAGLKDYIADNPSLPFVMIILIVNLVRAVGLILFLLSRRIPGWIRMFVFILMAYFAMAAGPIANTRYFLPVSLIAIGAAATAIGNRLQQTR